MKCSKCQKLTATQTLSLVVAHWHLRSLREESSWQVVHQLADEEHEGCGDGGAGAALLLHSPCSAT